MLRGGARLYGNDGYHFFTQGKFVYVTHGIEFSEAAMNNPIFPHPDSEDRWMVPPTCWMFGTVEEMAVFIAFAGIEHS